MVATVSTIAVKICIVTRFEDKMLSILQHLDTWPYYINIITCAASLS